MTSHNARPAFYAEDGVSLIDFKNISTVLANKVIITQKNSNEWQINSPYTIWINTGSKNCSVNLDKKPWMAGNDGKVIIPKGKHFLSFDTLSSPINTITINYISGELESAYFSENKLEFSYSEDVTTCYAILDKKTSIILIDGKQINCILFNGKEIVLRLPQGKHKVEVTN